MSKLNKVLRPGAECENFWRIFLQPIASLPITGSFDLRVNGDLDKVFLVPSDASASSLRAEIRGYYGGNLSDWDIKGGELNEQTLVFCGDNYTELTVAASKIKGARPYIWRRTNEL